MRRKSYLQAGCEKSIARASMGCASAREESTSAAYLARRSVRKAEAFANKTILGVNSCLPFERATTRRDRNFAQLKRQFLKCSDMMGRLSANPIIDAN